MAQDTAGDLDPELDLEDEPGDPTNEPDDLIENEEEPDQTGDDGQIDSAPAAQRQEDRQPSRRDARIQRILEDSRRKDADNADLRRRIDELSAKVSQPPVPQQREESDAERAARYESMSTGQAMVEALREAEERFNRRTNLVQAQTADQVDKTNFTAKASLDPLYAKWESRVEARLTQLRQQGINMNRDVLFKYMIGEAAIDRRATPSGKRDATEARQRVQQRRGRATDLGSDTAPSREAREQRRGPNTATAIERRLANVQI